MAFSIKDDNLKYTFQYLCKSNFSHKCKFSAHNWTHGWDSATET